MNPDSPFLVKDLIQGDESVSPLINGVSITDLREGLDLILKNPNLGDALKTELLAGSWKLIYHTKPPTIQEFLTSEWIGGQSESIYPHVRNILTDFWSPTSPYRHLILGTAVGTGKALPDSELVAVDEEDIYDIEFENGKVLAFRGKDILFVPEKGPTLVEEVIKMEDVNLPFNETYLIMMLYNIKRIPEFKEILNTTSYNELIEFFKTLPKEFLKEKNIYYQSHHIIPRSEGGNDSPENLVNLPFYFHIKAHFLRASELEKQGKFKEALNNYVSVRYMLGLGKSISKDLYEFLKDLDESVKSVERSASLERETVFVKKNGIDKRIFKDNLKVFLEEGWTRGVSRKSSRSTLGTVWINKNGSRKCIKPSELDKYLEDGWCKGSGSKTVFGKKWKWNEDRLNKKWFTNGVKEIFTSESPDGFEEGRLKSSVEGAKKYLKGKTYFTNGKINVMASECPEGFWKGMTKKPQLKKHFYTNGEKSVQAEECPEGFWPGRTIKNNPNRVPKKWYTNGKDFILAETCPEGFWPGKKKLDTKSSLIGKNWYTNGIESVRATECPEGFWRGCTHKTSSKSNLSWFTDGVVNVRAEECPDGFRPGLTRK